MDGRTRQESVLSLRSDFTQARLWPMQPMDIDPAGWLRNFDEEDSEVALALLDSFLFFNEEMTLSLLRSALASIAARAPFEKNAGTWNRFLENAVITYPTGENPNPTDSGHLFARHARTKLGFREEQICTPNDAVKLAESAQNPITLFFIDDIVGSGDQLVETWTRGYVLDEGGYTTLKDQFSEGKLAGVYVAAPIATEAAKIRLLEELPYFAVCAGHTLSADYSAGHDSTALVPAPLRSKLRDVVEKYAPRLECTLNEAYGHGGHGLNLAFAHSVPDLTLPLIWKDTPNWTPLRKRT